jgi:hypothetical protein
MQRWVALAAVAVLVVGCSSTGPDRRGDRAYQPRHSTNFTPPGPAHDPWGPYIAEASMRYDVPQAWIRAIIQVESSGQTHLDGRPITSRSGAMGLMQIMPITWGDLSRRHGFGDDPHDPRENILGGTAYIREMYDRFGAPAFAAAYNAGPGRLTEHLRTGRPLSQETTTYIALVAPAIEGIHPRRLASVAPAQVAVGEPPQSRARAVYAAARPGEAVPHRITPPVQLAQAPSRSVVASPLQPPRLPAPPAAPVAVTRPPAAPPGGWGVQVGAFSTPDLARAALQTVAAATPELATGRAHLVPVQTNVGALHRARLVGLTEEQAINACSRLARSGQACTRLSPDQAAG